MKNNTRCINRILANEEYLISYKKDKFRHHIMMEFYFIVNKLLRNHAFNTHSCGTFV